MGDEAEVTRCTARGRARAQLRNVRPDQWTAEKKRDFLAALVATANVRKAARTVGMSDGGAYKLRQRSAEFRAAWDAAVGEGFVRLELMLLERAIGEVGARKAVETAAATAGAAKMREYSDKGALALLQAHRNKQATAAAAATKPRRRELGDLRRRLETRLDEIARRMKNAG